MSEGCCWTRRQLCSYMWIFAPHLQCNIMCRICLLYYNPVILLKSGLNNDLYDDYVLFIFFIRTECALLGGRGSIAAAATIPTAHTLRYIFNCVFSLFVFFSPSCLLFSLVTFLKCVKSNRVAMRLNTCKRISVKYKKTSNYGVVRAKKINALLLCLYVVCV